MKFLAVFKTEDMHVFLHFCIPVGRRSSVRISHSSSCSGVTILWHESPFDISFMTQGKWYVTKGVTFVGKLKPSARCLHCGGAKFQKD